jgi:hypothetical protein
MNNTTTRRNLTIVAILVAATLVVGTIAATTTVTQSAAFAYSKNKKDNGKGNDNGNTVTIQKCKQEASESGWDNNQEQECENLICTHPGENATCVQEGQAAAATPTQAPVKKTCEQCFKSLLTSAEINGVLASIKMRLGADSLAEFCTALQANLFPETVFRAILNDAKVDVSTQNEIIACLKDVGIVLLT